MNYDPSLCGFGKSTRAFEKINSQKNNVIYAAVSIEQANDAINTKKHIRISRSTKLIHSNEVKYCTNTFCKEVHLSPCIATTHDTLFNAMMRGELNLKNTEVFIDELPSSITFAHSIVCTFETFKLIQEFVDFVEFDHKYSMVQIKEKQINSLKNIVKRGNDEFWKHKPTAALANFLLSVCHNTYIPNSKIDDLKSLKPNGDTKQFQALSVITVEAVKQFKSFTILSALFQCTATFHFLKLFGHELKNIAALDSLHRHDHDLSIEYFLPQYSATYRDKLLKNSTITVGERIAEAQLEIAGDNYIAFSNKHLRTHYQSDNCAVLTTVFGHNSYSEYTLALFNSSTLPTPFLISTMRAFGATSDMIYTEYRYLIAYQFMMRTALRKEKNKDKCRFICVDEKTAFFISKLFKNPKLIKHILNDVDEALGISNEKKLVPPVARKIKSTFEKKYDANLLKSEHKSTIKSIEKYMCVMEEHYTKEQRVFDFDMYRKINNKN